MLKKQIYEKDSRMGRILKQRSSQIKIIEGNMDSAKYIDILESSFDEMNSILPNGWILQ